MKTITAIIRPWKLDDLQLAVARLGVQGLTVTEVAGYSRQRGHSEHDRDAQRRGERVPRLRIDIVVDDPATEPVVEAVQNVTRTGKTGDGKVLITSISQAVRIRTRETGAAAA